MATRQRSVQVPFPERMFSGWAFRIEPVHWVVLGVTLRTFVRAKVEYQAWAVDEPPSLDFYPGYVFTHRGDRQLFIQVAAADQGAPLEVHTGRVGVPGGRLGFLLSARQLADWLRTGGRPECLPVLKRGEGKAGLVSWEIASSSDSCEEIAGGDSLSQGALAKQAPLVRDADDLPSP